MSINLRVASPENWELTLDLDINTELLLYILQQGTVTTHSIKLTKNTPNQWNIHTGGRWCLIEDSGTGKGPFQTIEKKILVQKAGSYLQLFLQISVPPLSAGGSTGGGGGGGKARDELVISSAILSFATF